MGGGRAAGRARTVRRTGSRRRGGDRGGAGARPRGRCGGERRDRQGRLLVAGDDSEDAARAGDRDALPDPDRLPGGFRGGEPPLSGGRLSGPVRCGPPLLLQLDHAALSAHSAARRGDGPLHRGRRVPARALRRHRDGRGDQLHGARGAQPREGRDRAQRRGRGAGRRARAHHGVRSRALPGRRRPGVPHQAARAGARAARRGRSGERGARAPGGAARARPDRDLRAPPGRSPPAVRRARAARGAPGPGSTRRVPARARRRDDLRHRPRRWDHGRRDRRSAHRGQGSARRTAALRRDRLHGERAQGRALLLG